MLHGLKHRMTCLSNVLRSQGAEDRVSSHILQQGMPFSWIWDDVLQHVNNAWLVPKPTVIPEHHETHKPRAR